MNYQRFIVGDLETNCYLLWSDKAAGVIDPGGPVDEVIEYIDKAGLEIKWIINTHGHADHIAGNAIIQERYGAPVLIHVADRVMLQSATANLSAFFSEGVLSPEAAKTLEDNETVTLGELKLKVIATPGHTPGGISLYTEGLLFSGDSLFQASIGRTDFPGGDYRALISGIKDRLLTLPPETIVLPGHGDSTTIARETDSNPFLAGEDEI